ncbi:hypothetical protein GCM10023322_18810 [Rugosimonospora acidiphila]|uniref:DUF202 domain-containing protein n=1 Tax=Rugosimonospora acidiphila TaxID=556531 RepID=A0ABP9RQ08_9ACTN
MTIGPHVSDGDEDPDEPAETARLRTRLSWRRTALSATGVLLLTARAALLLDPVPAAVIIALGTLAWLGLLALCRNRMTAMSGNPPDPAGRIPAGLALGIAGFAILGIAAAVLP